MEISLTSSEVCILHSTSIAKRGEGYLAVTGNGLMEGKASFDIKFICLKEFCPGL